MFPSYSCSLYAELVGLLVGACVNRAPEGTFGAAVAEVGVMDLLKVCSCLEVKTTSLTSVSSSINLQ